MMANVRRATWLRLVLCGVFGLVVLAVAAWIAMIVLRPAYPSPAMTMARMKAQAALTGGAKVYAAHCAYCHDTGFAPPIAGRALSAEAIAGIVRLGPGTMPAFPESQVSQAEIDAVATYLNGLPAAAPRPGSS